MDYVFRKCKHKTPIAPIRLSLLQMSTSLAYGADRVKVFANVAYGADRVRVRVPLPALPIRAGEPS